MVGGNILATNPTSSLHNKHHIKSGANEVATLCNMLPYEINGVHIQVNFLIMNVASINTCDTSQVGLPEVAAHLVASILTQ